MNLRDAILAHTPSLTAVPCPEIGQSIFVPSPVNAADFYAVLSHRPRPESEQVVRVFIEVARDDQGARLFTEADCDACAKLPWPTLSRVVQEFWRHNGYEVPNVSGPAQT